ncbi:hypothetical protein BVC80_9069g35 [Macleaya cordata]|uniref:Uncharacterized protein n=1 Tax=Macleaya cordata TaxID=56857 RepID=A0A200PP09_MACCD|nr:hypothetical protein BVC80_9069g35 [Macleaya cordata]
MVVAAAMNNIPAGGGGNGGAMMRQCLCSPTQHPGSFRCRHHQSEYEWGGRKRPKVQF